MSNEQQKQDMNQVFDTIRKALSSGLKTKVTFGKSIEEFNCSFSNIQKNIKEMENDNKPSEFDANKIVKTLDFCLEKVKYEPVDD